MDMQIDYEFLCKDLSGNSALDDALNEANEMFCLVGFKAALDYYKNFSETYPESPCGWFCMARCISENFTRRDFLEKRETRKDFNNVTEYLKKAVSTAPLEQKAQLEELLRFYIDESEKRLADSFVEKFSYVTDSLLEVEQSSRNRCPYRCSPEVYVSFSYCEMFNMLMKEKHGTFYALDDDLIMDVGRRYPSILLVKLHEKVIDYYIGLYNDTTNAQLSELANSAFWVSRKGIEYTYEHPVKEELWEHYVYKPYSGPSLAGILKCNMPDFSQVPYDPRVHKVFGIFFLFMKRLELKLGDLSSVGLPEQYYNEIKDAVLLLEDNAKFNIHPGSGNNADKEKSKFPKGILFAIGIILIIVLGVNAADILSAIFEWFSNL